MKVRISREHYATLVAYATHCKVEMGGMGKIAMTQDGDIEVKSIYVVKQQAHSTTCELDAEDLGRLEYEARNDSGEMALWWHSHCDMGVMPSHQDTQTMNKMAGNGRCLMLIINRAGDTHAEYTFAGDSAKLIPAATVKADVVVVDHIDLTRIKREIKEMVLPFAMPAIPPTTNRWSDQKLIPSDDTLGSIWEESFKRNVRHRKEKAELRLNRKRPEILGSVALQPSMFNILDSLYGIVPATGYKIAQSKYHHGTVYLCREFNGTVSSVPHSEYEILTGDGRQSLKDMVSK